MSLAVAERKCKRHRSALNLQNDFQGISEDADFAAQRSDREKARQRKSNDEQIRVTTDRRRGQMVPVRSLWGDEKKQVPKLSPKVEASGRPPIC